MSEPIIYSFMEITRQSINDPFGGKILKNGVEIAMFYATDSNDDFIALVEELNTLQYDVDSIANVADLRKILQKEIFSRHAE